MFSPRPRQYVIVPAKPKSNLEEMLKKYPNLKSQSYYNEKGYHADWLMVIATIYREGEVGEGFLPYHSKQQCSKIDYELHVSWHNCIKKNEEFVHDYYEEIYEIDTVYMDWGMGDEEADLLLDLMRSSNDATVEGKALRSIWNKFVCPRIIDKRTNGNGNKKLIKECLSGYFEFLFEK